MVQYLLCNTFYGRPCNFCNGLIKLYYFKNLVLEECLWCNVYHIIRFMADRVISAMD